jgi:triacylglycerol esterase/lipase EstA (alpha/beta hydrolase family)
VQTFEGIDVCGERLAEEIKEVVQANPGLKYISLLGHSMGGLMIRFALS